MGFVCFLLVIAVAYLAVKLHRMQKRLNAVAAIAGRITTFGVIDV